MTEVVETIDVENTLGEGPVWDDRIERLWWTDIHTRTMYYWDWSEREAVAVPLPNRLASFSLTSERDCLLCAFATGFALLRTELGKIEWLHRIEPEYRGIRLNDGRVDRSGRFWAGSMVENAQVAGSESGSLYSIEPNGRLSTHFDGITISNSICFAPDGATMYFTDTPKGRIEKFDVSPEGALSNRSMFTDVAGEGVPDGSEIDAAGRLWNAEWGAGQISCYLPDGSLKSQVNVPASRPTCIAFGGPQLDHMFVTTSRLELNDDDLAGETDAGKVLILKGEAKGIPAPKFALDQIEQDIIEVTHV